MSPWLTLSLDSLVSASSSLSGLSSELDDTCLLGPGGKLVGLVTPKSVGEVEEVERGGIGIGILWLPVSVVSVVSGFLVIWGSGFWIYDCLVFL